MKIKKEFSFNLIINKDEFELIRDALICFINNIPSDDKELDERASDILLVFNEAKNA